MKVMRIFKTLFPDEEARDIKIESWKKTFEEREDSKRLLGHPQNSNGS